MGEDEPAGWDEKSGRKVGRQPSVIRTGVAGRGYEWQIKRLWGIQSSREAYLAAVFYPTGFVSFAFFSRSVWQRGLLLTLWLTGLSLVGCNTSRVEEDPSNPLAAPNIEGEWLLIDIIPEPAYRSDPSTLTYQRLAWMSTVRPLWRGTVQKPRWVFQKDGKVTVRWPAAGNFRGRRNPGGTWHRNWRTRALTLRREGDRKNELPIQFSGDTLLLTDPVTHLQTRFLPVY